MKKLIVGVDIGKHNHQATIIDESGQILGGSIRFTNTTAGAKLLLSRIAGINPDGVPIVFGLEATGHYWLCLYSFLVGKGYSVHVINPYQSDAWRKVYMSSTKTDKEDAFLIADIIRFGSFAKTKLADEKLVSLRNMTRFRVGVSQQITDTKRRIITVLDQVFPEFEKLFSSVFGKTALTLLENHPTPDDLESVSITKLTSLIHKVSRGHFKSEKAHEIKKKARTSFGITIATDSFTFQLKLLMQQLSFLKEQLITVDDEIDSLMQDIDTVLVTIPGINTILAASIIAEIGDISRFKTSSQLVSFAGINPTVRQSGNFTGTKNRMSKKGSPYLRFALWKAAVTAVQFNPELKAYYERRKDDGKHHMVVIGAVARKLTGMIFSMLKHNQSYNADYVTVHLSADKSRQT
jgi:transposase